MKRTIRLFRRIILFFVLTVFMLLSIVNAPWFFVSSKTTTTDYSNWMSETLDTEAKIIDIAMLGAHDAFTHEIDIFSPVDNKSAEGLMQGFVGKLIKGFSIRQSKTQVVSTEDLLKSGVRYFDMRLSFNEEEEQYYTVHNYFSSPLNEVLSGIENFLSTNPGEFLIIDIQHVYGVDYDSLEDFEEVYQYFDDASLTQYTYQNNIKALKDITYGDITQNKSTSGLIIFSKFQSSNSYFFDYETSIRSSWANEDEFPKIVEFLDNESLYIQENPTILKGIRIMQAVATMEMSATGILRSFESWSLLGRARDFNQYLLEYENIENLLDSMPVLMIDFTSDKEIIDEIMVLIINYNS